MKYWSKLLLLPLAFMVACGGGGSKSVNIPADLEGFEIYEVPGTDYLEAIKYENDKIKERGMVKDGVKHGTWVTYHSKKDYPATIASFANGKLNGPFIRMNDRGYITLSAACLDGVYEGEYLEYENFKVRKRQTLIGGNPDGVVTEYYNNGKKRSELNFVKGVQEGKAIYYDQEEKILQEYTYKNGEMVEGE